MDDYISKPIDGNKLTEMVENLSGPAITQPVAAPLSDKIFDRDEALRRLQSDEELLSSLAKVFLNEHGDYLAEIHNAIQLGDFPTLERAAHTMKGSAATFGGARTAQVALELETTARRGDLTE